MLQLQRNILYDETYTVSMMETSSLHSCSSPAVLGPQAAESEKTVYIVSKESKKVVYIYRGWFGCVQVNYKMTLNLFYLHYSICRNCYEANTRSICTLGITGT